MGIKLSQTVAGNWVITVPNPEERGWETQLAEFNVESVEGEARSLMESVMISMFASFILHTEDKEWEVTSHDQIVVAEMVGLVQQKLQQDQRQKFIKR